MEVFVSKLWISIASTFLLLHCVNANDIIFANFVKISASDIPSSDVLGMSFLQVSKCRCASLCLQNQDCLYFAKRTQDKSCVLISTSIGSSFDSTIGISIFYEKKGSPAVDPCLAHSCINGGSCLPMQATYSCGCNTGYTGEFCQTDIDYCSPNPCLNGGVCTDGVTTFTCSCNGGYSDVTCGCNEFSEMTGYELFQNDQGSETGTMGITTAEDCKAFCSTTSDCVAVDFYDTPIKCLWYTNSVNADLFMSQPNCISFKKEAC